MYIFQGNGSDAHGQDPRACPVVAAANHVPGVAKQRRSMPSTRRRRYAWQSCWAADLVGDSWPDQLQLTPRHAGSVERV
jgi:hypothetical protein